MKRNFVVGMFGGLVGSAMLLVVLSAAGIVGARSADVPRDEVRSNAISAATSLTSTFTYQGQLISNSLPINNTCDFHFSLYDALSAGNRVGITQTVSSVSVSRGLFTALLNTGNQFGDTAFNGNARWLSIAVRCPAGTSGAYTTLIPRQPLTSLPFALPGLRTFPNVTSPNIVGGFSGNSVISPAVGSTIGGGGESPFANTITNSYAFIGGGSGNIVHGSSAVIGGGASNHANGSYAIVGGGFGNQANGNSTMIGGGNTNQANGDSAMVGGGDSNQANGVVATIGGGFGNHANGREATVGGGGYNVASGYAATIPGGESNQATLTYTFAAGNMAQALHQGAFVWADSTGTPFASTGSDQFLIRATGGVGIGTNAPLDELHVVRNIATTAAINTHVALIENTATSDGGDVLALRINYTGMADSSDNFITFFTTTNTSLGSIEGNGSGGVVMSGPGNDYAEYLPRANANETLNPGDVVGIIDGRVTRATHGATQFMVISTGPIVVGNDPGDQRRDAFARIVFIGQAQVRVRGLVHAGDFIIPSGDEDGTGLAVSPDTISADQFAQVVGQAWTSSAAADLKTVTVAVGLLRNDPTVAHLTARVTALEQTLSGQAPADSLPTRDILILGALFALVGIVVGRRLEKAASH